MLTLSQVQALFPKQAKNSAVTGPIPIEHFEKMEFLLRPLMQDNKLRAMYRGPRVSNNSSGYPSMTRRCDATHVVLYRKS